jgi:hypothetical protein
VAGGWWLVAGGLTLTQIGPVLESYRWFKPLSRHELHRHEM